MTSDIAFRMESYFDRLFPLPRSLTGPGIRQSLAILSEMIPLEILAFPTGSRVFDWTVPEEWVPRDAYIVGPDGKKRADFRRCNLHLVGYSAPFRGRMTLAELRGRIRTLPDKPRAVPYVTSYYDRTWGFCMSHEEFTNLPDGAYDVVVDTELKSGELVLGELVLAGETPAEILFSSYLCHPSLAGNELAGPLILAFLYEMIAALPRRRYTYRFVLGPETIGSLCYLSRRGAELKKNLVAGYVLTCLGDAGPFTYKASREGNTPADRAVRLALRDESGTRWCDYDPTSGSDERQYGSPGFNLPVGVLMRTPAGEYPEYHTSLDDKSYVSFAAMARSAEVIFGLVRTLDTNETWLNLNPYGEPQLGKRGLYSSYRSCSASQLMGDSERRIRAILWVLNQSDGAHDMMEIAEKSGFAMEELNDAARELESHGLLSRHGDKALQLRRVK